MADHPDWGRFGLTPPNQYQKVGDPTRWGAIDSTNVISNGFAQSTAQILQIQTRDAYSRSWTVIGTLSMPVSVWDSVFGPTLASVIVTMGVGQVQIAHKLCLWSSGGAVGAPGGLCYTQDIANGGPYLNPDPELVTINGVAIAYQTRAFAAVGSLVGQAIGMIAEYGTLGVNPDLPAPAKLSLMVTPYAAGEGL